MFKKKKNRYVIWSILLTLKKNKGPLVAYESLKNYFRNEGISGRLSEVREAVLAVRGEKLHSPQDIPNAGSFFKNPVVKKLSSKDC